MAFNWSLKQNQSRARDTSAQNRIHEHKRRVEAGTGADVSPPALLSNSAHHLRNIIISKVPQAVMSLQ